MGDTYLHGHHSSVLRSHRWRTAENSAAYLLPHLRPGQDLLDVGCGPGTITVDLAARVAPGRVVGLDASADVVAQAAALDRPEGVDFRFVTGDVYALDFPDDSFDVVHAHQILHHLTDPVAALREMRRVVRPDGLVAVRETDFPAFAWAPREPLMERWLDLFVATSRRNGTNPDAGPFLLGWAQQAGFTDVVASSSTWTFADPGSRTWWGGLWAERVEQSGFAEHALGFGLSDADELAAIAGAWRHWATQPDAVFIVVHGEVLARS